MSNFYLLTYILLWVVTILRQQKKERREDVVFYINALYLSLGVISFILFNDKSVYGIDFKELSLFPFVYLFFTLQICLKPLRTYCNSRYNSISKVNENIIRYIAIFFIGTSLVQLPSNIINLQEGVMKIIFDMNAGLDAYNDAALSSDTVEDGTIINIFYIFSAAFSEIGIFILFYYLTKRETGIIIKTALVVSVVGVMIDPISKGNRTVPMQVLLALFFAYMLFKPYMREATNTIVKRIGIVLMIILMIPLVSITISRFSESNSGALGSVEKYLGQSTLIFNNYAFDSGGIRYGDRTFPLFKRMIGFDNVPSNYSQRRTKYSNMKIDDSHFISFVGDFVLDYGPIMAFFILLFFAFVFDNIIKCRSDCIPIYNLLAVYFLLNIVVQGSFYLFSYADVGGNLKIITYTITYIVLKQYGQKIRS